MVAISSKINKPSETTTFMLSPCASDGLFLRKRQIGSDVHMNTDTSHFKIQFCIYISLYSYLLLFIRKLLPPNRGINLIPALIIYYSIVLYIGIMKVWSFQRIIYVLPKTQLKFYLLTFSVLVRYS